MTIIARYIQYTVEKYTQYTEEQYTQYTVEQKNTDNKKTKRYFDLEIGKSHLPHFE